MANIPHTEIIDTVTVAGQFLYSNTNYSSFTANIFIAFQPDIIVLKHIVFTDLDATNGDPVCFIRSDLVDNRVLYAYCDTASASDYVNTQFRNFKAVQGTYTFNVSNFLGNPVKNPGTINFTVALTFEFYKYRPLPQIKNDEIK